MDESLPTSRELEALKVFWERGEASVRDVYRALQTDSPDLAYTTVLSLIQTMERKDLVEREGQGRGLKHLYRAKVTAQRTLRSLAGDFLTRVFDGAVEQYLVSALESRPPDETQIRELQRMISEAKKNLKRK